MQHDDEQTPLDDEVSDEFDEGDFDYEFDDDFEEETEEEIADVESVHDGDFTRPPATDEQNIDEDFD